MTPINEYARGSDQQARELVSIAITETARNRKVGALRQIVAERQYARVDGRMVDLSSAAAILAVYDQLSPDLQARYADMTIARMVSMAFVLLQKKGAD